MPIIPIEITDFDWDDANSAKCQKHGVSQVEIELLFELGETQILPDVKHSESERRYYAAGRGNAGKPMLVTFTLRLFKGGVYIRPISSRYSHLSL